MSYLYRITSSPLLKGLLIGLSAFLSALIFSLLDISRNLELLSLDVRFRIRPEIKKSEDIVLINFDDQSLQQYGSWPWSRFYQTVLLETLRRYKTGPIIFDVLFSEPEPSVITTEGNADSSRQNPNLRIVNHDREFAEAVRRAGSVFLAYSTRDPSLRVSKNEIASETERLRLNFTETKRQAVLYLESNLAKTPRHFERFIYKSVDLDPPLMELLKAAKGFGFAQPGYSSDGTIRNFILFRHYNGYLLTPLVLSAFSELKGIDINNPTVSPGREINFKTLRASNGARAEEISIPVDENLQALLNWPGAFESSFTHLSFRDIAYFYAFHRAMDTASRAAHTAKIYSPKVAKSLIIKELQADNLISSHEIEGLAAEAIASAWSTKYIKEGYSENHIMKLLHGAVDNQKIKEALWGIRTALRAEVFLRDNPEGKLEDFIGKLELSEKEKIRVSEMFIDLRMALQKSQSYELTHYLFPKRIGVMKNGLKASLSPFDLQDKIIIIGLTGKGTVDLSPTPFEKSCPMVFYHASALNMLINESFLYHPPKGLRYLAALLLALFIGLASARCSVPLLTLFSALAALVYLFASYWLWVNKGLWVETVLPLFALFIAYLIALISQFLKVYSEKSKIRSLFSAMVSPVVLSVMEKYPERFSLTGERRHATTYFSKIEGIESLTRSFTPEELPVFLSSYLTPMSNIIMDYGGYIDKYEGAVIMADFGVPLEDRGNSYKCAYAALEQVYFARSFGYALYNRYSASISISIGINSGYVSAGNMGSDRKFQYTVMGDAVNIAARFMAANYIYRSTYPLTGEDTASLLNNFVYARPLDKLLLKGKTIPTKVYDILGWKAEAYREIMKDKPIPGFVYSLWAMPPAESIYYFADFWERQRNRTDHPLSDRLASFFKGYDSYADEWIIHEFLCDAIGVKDNIASLSARLSRSSRLQGHVSDCTALILSCKEELESIKELVRFTEQEESFAALVEALSNKLSLLSKRHEKHTEIIAENKALIDSLLRGALENIQDRLRAIKLKYKSEAENFIGTIKAQEYHQLLSITGEPEHKEIIGLFELGLSLYWRRQWDDALEAFRKALTIDPQDSPAQGMIKRIEEFKDNPPNEDWQGEFIQTKK